MKPAGGDTRMDDTKIIDLFFERSEEAIQELDRQADIRNPLRYLLITK